MWHDMWSPSVAWWSLILRAGIVYVFVLVLLRATGKRQIGQLAPCDLVLLLILSNAVQNAMNAGDNSITGGVLLSCTLIGLNYLTGWLTFKSKAIERLIEGRPVILIHDGHVDPPGMAQAQMTMHELEAALRQENLTCPDQVRFALLENNGQMTIIPMKRT